MNTREKLLLVWAVAATGLLLALVGVTGWMLFPRPLRGVSLQGAAEMPTGAVALYQCNREAKTCAPISTADNIFLKPDNMFSAYARSVRLGAADKFALVWVAHDAPMESHAFSPPTNSRLLNDSTRMHYSSMEWRAFSPISTHLGCFVWWHEESQRFEDPCSGARWERDGAYREGPAPRALDYYPVRVENGDVLIDFQLMRGAEHN